MSRGKGRAVRIQTQSKQAPGPWGRPHTDWTAAAVSDGMGGRQGVHLTWSSASGGSRSTRKTWFRSKVCGKYRGWQTFSVRESRMENRRRWMVKVWGRWVSFTTCRSQTAVAMASGGPPSRQVQRDTGASGAIGFAQRRERESADPSRPGPQGDSGLSAPGSWSCPCLKGSVLRDVIRGPPSSPPAPAGQDPRPQHHEVPQAPQRVHQGTTRWGKRVSIREPPGGGRVGRTDLLPWGVPPAVLTEAPARAGQLPGLEEAVQGVLLSPTAAGDIGKAGVCSPSGTAPPPVGRDQRVCGSSAPTRPCPAGGQGPGKSQLTGQKNRRPGNEGGEGTALTKPGAMRTLGGAGAAHRPEVAPHQRREGLRVLIEEWEGEGQHVAVVAAALHGTVQADQGLRHPDDRQGLQLVHLQRGRAGAWGGALAVQAPPAGRDRAGDCRSETPPAVPSWGGDKRRVCDVSLYAPPPGGPAAAAL